MKTAKQTPKRQWLRGVWAAAALVAMYVIIPQLNGFERATTVLKQAHGDWVLLALLGSLATYLLAAGVYMSLALRRLRLAPTILVQAASKLANSILPAGFGALGINYRYLRQMQHSRVSAVTIVTINNTLGFVGNALLVLVFVVSGQAGLPRHHLPAFGHQAGLLAAVILALSIGAAWWWRRRIATVVRVFAENLRKYGSHPFKLLLALGWSMILTAGYAMILYACCRAVDIQLPFVTSLLVMSVGVAGSSLIPTPGGVGSVETGMVAALVLFDVAAGPGLAIVLLYRLVTFWLPLVTGIPALFYARQKRYL